MEVYIMERPYRCNKCDSVFYAEKTWPAPPHGRYLVSSTISDGGFSKDPVYAMCDGQGEFAGLEDWELDKVGTQEVGALTVRLNEGHVWEGEGMLNPHAKPLNDTLMYQKYKAEGRIRRDSRGIECLYSKNKEEYKKSLKEMGFDNVHGDGDISRSRQQGDQFRSD